MTQESQEKFKIKVQKEAIDKIVGQQEIDEFKTKVQKETIDSIIKQIKIDDTYFYAEMIIFGLPMMEDPFSNKVKVRTRINLFNSTEFKNENLVDSSRKHLKAKIVVSETTIDKDELDSKEDAMRLVYKIISEEIAKTLFEVNRYDINMLVQEEKRYI